MNTTKFILHKTYEMRFIGDSDLKVNWECIKITPKTATFKREGAKETMTRKIKIYNNVESVLEGSYSMAPSIYADKIVRSLTIHNCTVAPLFSRAEDIKEGDLISFNPAMNTDRLQGRVENKGDIGLIVMINDTQYELRKMIDIKFINSLRLIKFYTKRLEKVKAMHKLTHHTSQDYIDYAEESIKAVENGRSW